MYYIDTNIFIRAITGDDVGKKERCQKLFKKIALKELVATTTESVIAEIVYVLNSKKVGYCLSRDDIQKRLSPILQLPYIKIPNKPVYLRALELFRDISIDFEDAIVIAFILSNDGSDCLYSYDQKLSVGGLVKRLEP